jgi:biopolymer transport protein ExbD
MAKFRTGGKKEMPTISTASLPDIVFMLLFFFMVSTVIRETSLKVDNTLPGATEVKKLEKKSLVSYIYIGKPRMQFQDMYGTEPRIQLNDAFAKVSDIRDYIVTERQQLDESDRPKMTTSLKVDEDTKMGIVTDVKQALRKASALKINYSAREVQQVY